MSYVHTGPHGEVCDSGYEVRILSDLAGQGISYDYQPSPLSYSTKHSRGYCKACGSTEVFQDRSYTPDIKLPNGVYVESKGRLDPQGRVFLKAVVTCNPRVPLVFMFQRNNKFGKDNSYSKFADSIGVPWIVGTKIPNEWLTPEFAQRLALAAKGGELLKKQPRSSPKPPKAGGAP